MTVLEHWFIKNDMAVVKLSKMLLFFKISEAKKYIVGS